jgi:hypothetical protein
MKQKGTRETSTKIKNKLHEVAKSWDLKEFWSEFRASGNNRFLWLTMADHAKSEENKTEVSNAGPNRPNLCYT